MTPGAPDAPPGGRIGAEVFGAQNLALHKLLKHGVNCVCSHARGVLHKPVTGMQDGVTRNAVISVNQCGSLRHDTQHGAGRHAAVGRHAQDQVPVQPLEFPYYCPAGGSEQHIMLGGILGLHDFDKPTRVHLGICAPTIQRQLTQDVTDAEQRICGDAVFYSVDARAGLYPLELVQNQPETAQTMAHGRVIQDDALLIGVITKLIKQDLVLCVLENPVKQPQRGMSAELTQGCLPAGGEIVHDLSEGLHDISRLVLLFGDGSGHSLHVIITVFVMIETELPHRTVIQYRAVHQHIVTVQIQPAENIFPLELRRGACEILANTLQKPTIPAFPRADCGRSPLATWRSM